QWNQRGEQFFRVRLVGDEIEVDEEDALLPDAADVLDHPRHRLLELLVAPRRGRDAELTVVAAGARRLEDRLGQKSAAVEQLAPRERHLPVQGKVERLAVLAP